MAESFATESIALLAACKGEKVNWSDIQLNFDLKKSQAGSANHRLGSNPAGGLDAFRRGDMAVVNKVLDWAEWLVTQPLHENEGLCSAQYYRERMDAGTYALALLASLATGRSALAAKLFDRDRASFGWSLLGIFKGGARELVKNDPQPIDKPHLLFADGPVMALPGAIGFPHVASAGMRGLTRKPAEHGRSGPYDDFDRVFQRVMVADAVGIAHGVRGEHKWFAAIRKRLPSIPPWGLSPADVEVALAFLGDPQNVELARIIHGWTLSCLPLLPFTVVQRASGAKEFVMRHAHGASNGALGAEICNSDGTRYLLSPDNGQRGGKEDERKNHQPFDVTELVDRWEAKWTSGEGRMIACPRPPAADAVAWRVDSSGRDKSDFWPPKVTPVPVPPVPLPAPKPQPKRKSLWRKLLELLGMACVLAAPLGATAPPNVFLAIAGDPPTQELWLDRGPAIPPLKLNGPLQQTPGMRGFVNSFTVSMDGSRVAYTANARAAKPLDFELWSVPITGPPERRISQNLTSDYDVATAIKFDLYGHRVVYRVGRSSIGDWVLWSALWTGGGITRLSWASMPAGRMVRADFQVISGNRVRFASDYEIDETFAWYVVDAEGGRILRELFADGFESGDRGAWS